MHHVSSQLKQQASVLMRQDRHAEAAALYTRYLTQHPQDAHAASMLALALINAGANKAGRQAAQQAIATDPQEPMAHYALALGILSDPMHTSPQFVPWVPQTWAYRKKNKQPPRENRSLKSPRLREAEQHMLQAIRLAPDAAFLHAQLALIRLNDLGPLASPRSPERPGSPGSPGSPSASVQDAINTGLQLDPEDPLCHEYQVRLYLAQSDPAAAYRAAQQLLSLEPNDPTAHALMARCLLQQRPAQVQQAIEHARTAARLDPADDETRDVLMECFHQRHAVYRWPMRWAQAIHRQFARRSRWLVWGVAAAVIGGIAGLLAIVAYATDSPGLLGNGLGVLAVLGVLIFVGTDLPRYIATACMMRDPDIRPGIPQQAGVEAALFVAGALYALPTALIWWQWPLTAPGKMLLFSAASFVPALAALICAAASDLRKMWVASIALFIVWSGCTAAVLYLNWPLAPVLYLLPLCLAVGMAAWVANRENHFER